MASFTSALRDLRELRDAAPVRRGGRTQGAAGMWLARHGYPQWATCQPGSRFWHFQFIEGSWLLVFSLILITATIWPVLPGSLNRPACTPVNAATSLTAARRAIRLIPRKGSGQRS